LTPKILEQLELASRARDDEALAIFRHLSESLDNLGLSWTSLARCESERALPNQGMPPPPGNTLRFNELLSENDFGIVLRAARDAVGDLKWFDDDRYLAFGLMCRAEEQWLEHGFIDKQTLEYLSYSIPVFGVEMHNPEAYFGFAQDAWLESHREYLADLKKTRLAQEMHDMVEQKEAYSKNNVVAEGLRHEILEFARITPQFVETWREALFLMRPQADKFDLDGLKKALHNNNTKAARIAIVFLAGITPIQLWPYRPDISDLRDGSLSIKVNRHELDRDFGTFSRTHGSSFAGIECVKELRSILNQYLGLIPVK
tara:strand:- start:1419 stop:2363 length:945 start_codon:yes stop_codon:yes gene_type:complete